MLLQTDIPQTPKPRRGMPEANVSRRHVMHPSPASRSSASASTNCSLAHSSSTAIHLPAHVHPTHISLFTQQLHRRTILRLSFGLETTFALLPASNPTSELCCLRDRDSHQHEPCQCHPCALSSGPPVLLPRWRAKRLRTRTPRMDMLITPCRFPCSRCRADPNSLADLHSTPRHGAVPSPPRLRSICTTPNSPLPRLHQRTRCRWLTPSESHPCHKSCRRYISVRVPILLGFRTLLWMESPVFIDDTTLSQHDESPADTPQATPRDWHVRSRHQV
jgi:hypothetical protein